MAGKTDAGRGLASRWAAWELRAQSVLRIVAALMYVVAGTVILFAFPAGMPPDGGTAPFGSEIWVGGFLELVGGGLLVAGLFTRPVAFVLSGEMAVAYFQFHAPNGFWPTLNGGIPAGKANRIAVPATTYMSAATIRSTLCSRASQAAHLERKPLPPTVVSAMTPPSLLSATRCSTIELMCRSIRPLHNFAPPATEDEIRAAALQYVRKVSGYTRPSQANAAAFDEAVAAVTDATKRLMGQLVTSAPPRTREAERERARERWRKDVERRRAVGDETGRGPC